MGIVFQFSPIYMSYHQHHIHPILVLPNLIHHTINLLLLITIQIQTVLLQIMLLSQEYIQLGPLLIAILPLSMIHGRVIPQLLEIHPMEGTMCILHLIKDINNITLVIHFNQYQLLVMSVEIIPFQQGHHQLHRHQRYVVPTIQVGQKGSII